jgi:HlyD family secretion protein
VKEKSMRRHLKRVIVALVVLVVAIASVGAILQARNGSAPKTTYETAKVERGDVVSSVSATGIIQPLTTVEIKSNVGGRIDELAVELGDIVKKGQLIARIDPTDSLTQLNQAQARYRSSEARLAQARVNVDLQIAQSRSQIAQARQSLLSAQARLAQAERQWKVQPALTRANIAQAEANHKSAQDSLRRLQQATVPQGRASSQASLDQAEANLEEARKNLDRQRELLAKGFVPQSTVDAAVARFETTQAQLNSAQQKVETMAPEYDAQIAEARARVAQASAQLDQARSNSVQDQIRYQEYLSAKAGVEEARAQLRLAEANSQQINVKRKEIDASQSDIVSNQAALDQARVNMDYTTIVAPRAGVVLQKPVEEGTVIASSRSSVGNGPTIVVLGDNSRMFILCQVDETDIASVEVGQTCDITVDAYPNELFEGKVTRIDPQAKVEQNVTTIPVTVEIDSPDIRLKPGMNASVEFIVAKHEGVLTVPNEALKETDGRNIVQVMVAGKPTDRTVEVGIAGPDTTEIQSGLKEGEEIVTRVIEPVKPQATTGQSPFQQNFRGPRTMRGGGGGGGGGRGGGGGGGR